MSFDLEQTDKLLSTTRAVRRRLDLERDVPDDLLLRCIQLAEQAPSGGDISSRRWLVIGDPGTKKQLADISRPAGGNGVMERRETKRGTRARRVVWKAKKASGSYPSPQMMAVRPPVMTSRVATCSAKSTGL